MSEDTTEQTEAEQLGTFRLALGISYWMIVQGVAAFSSLRWYGEGKVGWMWLSIVLLGWASLMLWYRVDKWRTV